MVQPAGDGVQSAGDGVTRETAETKETGVTGVTGVTGEGSQPAETPSYEQARDELADVVRTLEAGGTTLEESLALWERGEHLAAVCERWLEGARARLSAARADRDAGSPEGTATPRA